MRTITTASRYDRTKEPEKKTYRYLTLAECKALSGHCEVIDQNGKVARVTITSVKTWKTRPNVQVGWKFGMYEFGRELITSDDDNFFFVIPLE